MDRAKRLSSELGSEGISSPAKKLKVAETYGTTGTPIQLVANYFQVNKKPQFVLSQYRVDFTPDVDVTDTRKKIVAQIKNEFLEELDNRYIFDGGSIYLTQRFNDKEINTTYNGHPMNIVIRHTGSIESSDPKAYQLFNLIFRDAMKGLQLKNIRRDYFDPHSKINVEKGNLELWPGYLTSIRAHDDDVLMCAEISHKVMRRDTILDITLRLMREHRNDWQEALKKEVIGTTVLTDYTNRTYFVDDIEFNMSPSSTFTPFNSDQPISYAAYYKQRYNIVIKDMNQFLLMSKSKERDLRAGQPEFIYLIPELCRATGMTDKMRADFSLMRDMSDFTRLNPANRVKALQNFNNRIQTTKESTDVLNEWQMDLDKNLIKIPGRELPAEPIIFGNGQEVPANDRGEWMFKNGMEMFQSVKVMRWVVIFPESLKQDAEKFVGLLGQSFEEMRTEMTDPLWISLPDDRQGTYIMKIRELAEKSPKIFLIVLPTNRADRYASVKKVCLIDLGIPAQVVVKKTMNNKNAKSIASKVAIQMNAKLGGRPWMIKLPVKGLMTVGFDVSHHPRDKDRSVGAMVATMDLKVSGDFYSVTSQYKDGNEMNIGLAGHMKKAIEIYKDTSKELPQKILFYRDGVGEGQIAYVMKNEVEPLLANLQKMYGEATPKLAYIIVNKRTNTRLFKPVNVSFANPKPGTVVDRQITLPERNDFFLISQHVGQGTVSPTAYNLIYNDTGLNKDKLEILTYKFCHLYYNWSGTTRMPAVCQYAKKLAFMTSQSLEGSVHEKLERSLYFL